MKLKLRRRANYGRIFNTRRAIPGKIRSDRKKTGVWQRADGEVYMTCFSCGAINKITDHLVSVHRYLTNCVTCVHCKGHFFTRLMRWKGPVYARCDRCGRMKKGDTKTKAKDFKGWHLSRYNGSLCSACRC